MESQTVQIGPENIELARYGSLCSKNLRRLFLNSVNTETGGSSTLDSTGLGAQAPYGSTSVNSNLGSTNFSNKAGFGNGNFANNSNIDLQLNLDNFLNPRIGDLTNSDSLDDISISNRLSTDLTLSSGDSDLTSIISTTSKQSHTNSSSNSADMLRHKRSKQDIEREWSTISESEPTHTALREWKSIQLRGFVDPKRFYKNSRNKLEEIPKRFQIGSIVSSSRSINLNNCPEDSSANSGKLSGFIVGKKRNRKKPSLITAMLKEDRGWVNKRYSEIQAEKTKGSKGWYHRQVKKRKRV